jgi:hypothetical protein
MDGMKYEYKEGKEARENFDKAMTAAFKAPKTPRPQPKRKKKPKDSKSGED